MLSKGSQSELNYDMQKLSGREETAKQYLQAAERREESALSPATPRQLMKKKGKEASSA